MGKTTVRRHCKIMESHCLWRGDPAFSFPHRSWLWVVRVPTVELSSLHPDIVTSHAPHLTTNERSSADTFASSLLSKNFECNLVVVVD